jgi:K(+)-stimulated pyrophosphate-energized sodium pump
MSRYDAGGEKVRGIADQIHLGAMVFMHREYKMLFAFAAVLVVGILVSPLGTNTAIAFVAGASVLRHGWLSRHVCRHQG